MGDERAVAQLARGADVKTKGAQNRPQRVGQLVQDRLDEAATGS